MATKLEYLQKYLTKPNQANELKTDRQAHTSHKKKRRKVAAVEQTLQIRDLSEALPKPRQISQSTGAAPQAKRLSLDVDEDSPPRQGSRQAPDDGSDGDLSPPRHAITAKQRLPQSRQRQGSNADLSPPRRRKGTDAATKTSKEEPDSDLSPPRVASSAQQRSPPRCQRHDSEADLSPPRPKWGKDAATKATRPDPDSDLSPPRATTAKPGTARRQRHDSDSDFSPPRPKKEKDAATSIAKEEPDSDLSPPRVANTATPGAARRQRHDSDSDLSPPRPKGGKDAATARAKEEPDSDLSPPRTGKPAEQRSPPHRKRHDSDSDISPPRQRSGKDVSKADADEEKMSSGLRAGLVSGKALREEAAKVRAERREAIEALPDSETGKGAETVYRNRQGGRIGREEWVEQQQKKRKKKMSEYPEQELAWGGGLKQQSNKEDDMAETARVAAEPFARYELGVDALSDLHEKQAWHDPMSKFDAEEEDDAGKGLPASSRKSAPVEKKKPICPHPPWPNRFGILPGYRWDGAVRGNNYEKRWLEAKNQREFQKTERYKSERLED